MEWMGKSAKLESEMKRHLLSEIFVIHIYSNINIIKGFGFEL